MDDIENRYGGWYDPDLSPAGFQGAVEVGKKLKEMNTGAKLIFSSPLKRALQTADKIGESLKLPVETFVYLKERNTYGLLSGEEKDEAAQKYSKLVEAYEGGEEVLGYESYDFLLKRIKVLLEELVEFEKDVLICVTHGKLMAALFKDVLGVEAKKFHDNCIAEIDIDDQGGLTLLNTDGVDF